jgi:hypothetical protein
MADALGITRSAVEKYRQGAPDSPDRVPMPAERARQLAKFLRSHADKLHKIADDLERFAKNR